MQDSLCGSMNLGIAGTPRSPKSCSGDFMILDMPGSPMHSPSIPDMATCEEHTHINYDLANYSPSASSIGDIVAAHDSLGSPNGSCWISDLIDELIEPNLDDTPMLFSPSRESSSRSPVSPIYSSFGEERQDLSGSPSLPSASMHCLNEDGVESAHASHQMDHFSSSQMMFSQQLDANYKQPALQNKHLQQHRQYHFLHQQRQQQLQQQQQQQHLPYDHQHQSRFNEAKSHFLQSISGNRDGTQTPTDMQAASSSTRFPYAQPLHVLPKVLSAPQLSKLDPPRSPRRNSVVPLSLPPTTKSSFYSSSQSMLYKRNNSSMSRSEYGGVPRRNSLVGFGSTSPHYYNPDSPPSLPRSLPATMGYLSYKMAHPKSSMQPLHPQGGRPASSHHRDTSMPLTAYATANELRESMASLQQSSNFPIEKVSEMRQQDSGLHLVHLLLACAEAVAKQNYFSAKEILRHLRQVVSTNGDSMQRVATYFTDALHSRLTGTGRRSYLALRSYDLATANEVLAAYQILYQACPYVKFAHFTSNQAIFEAFEGENRVHVVDLDIIQGYQWPAFIQALAARPGGAPHLRITGVGMPFESVQETGKRLSELAESLHVPFEFHPVGERLESLKSHMLQRRIGEALAVNSVNRLHRTLSEPMSPLFGVLHMIREQAPNIFTLVEQEASHNGPFFLGRFLEALHYYSALFDSLDATLPQTSPERVKVEQLVFSNEITNIVACEGGERVERHEKLEKWRRIMEGIGFENVALSANAVNQSRLLLGLYPCDGYTLQEDRGGLLLGWQERPIIAASAWRC